MTPSVNPIDRFIRHQGAMILDGGLATELEQRGHDLADDLWSARLLLEAPEALRDLHFDYLTAGADCIITASYQASLPGFAKLGLSGEESADLLRRSLQLGMEARDAFWTGTGNRTGRLEPLVAASIGPYGAFLADGSEYTGAYGLGRRELRAFHHDRWKLLIDCGAELLACETIPSILEAEVLLQLLAEWPRQWAWLSFCCRDATRLSDGTPLVEAARLCDAQPRVAAVGINCTAPEHVGALIGEIRKATDKAIVVYPNSGEIFDAGSKKWRAAPSRLDWNEEAARWLKLGARGIGGCCRVGPKQIRELRNHLVIPCEKD